MAENYNEQAAAANVESVETKDRGLFDFGKKDDDVKKVTEDEKFATEFDNKVAIAEPVKYDKDNENEDEEKKHGSLLEKLQRSGSSSSSSSDEDDDEEKKQRKKERKEKKGIKEKLVEKLPGHDNEENTTVPISKPAVEEVAYSEPSPVEKKGIVDKIKGKFTGEKTVEEHRDVVAEPVVEVEGEAGDKKGLLEKIKEKIPGFGTKDFEVKKDHDIHE